MKKAYILLVVYYILFVIPVAISNTPLKYGGVFRLISTDTIFIVCGIITALVGLFIKPASYKFFVLKIIPLVVFTIGLWISVLNCSGVDSECPLIYLPAVIITGIIVVYFIFLAVELIIGQMVSKNRNLVK